MFPAVRFVESVFLWLLFAPGLLLLMWTWQLARRRVDIRRHVKARILPIRERYPLTGELAFWLCVILAMVAAIVALARPQTRLTLVQRVGVDFIILQDGSTSMRVTDVRPDRWRRSTAWLRTFAETISWTDERVALALFAYRPAPQVRLTRDPNAFFFFLDHLTDEPPFRLEDNTSWDTNIEDGIAWGVRMIEKDEELYGQRRNVKAFVVLSDGQAWSGEVDKSLELARQHGIWIYVIGVGTTTGGLIPDLPPHPYDRRSLPIHSALDRPSLRAIADGGGGKYFELGVESDEVIALQLLADVQQRGGGTRREATYAELYWWFLVGAAGCLGLATALLRERTQLWWQLAGGVTLLVVWLA